MRQDFYESPDTFDYGLEPKVCIPAPVADLLLAVMVGLTPGPLGRLPKQSTLDARKAMEIFGWSKRTAARVIATQTGKSIGDHSGTIGRSFQNAVTQASIARISVPKETAVSRAERPCVKLGRFSHSA